MPHLTQTTPGPIHLHDMPRGDIHALHLRYGYSTLRQFLLALITGEMLIVNGPAERDEWLKEQLAKQNALQAEMQAVMARLADETKADQQR